MRNPQFKEEEIKTHKIKAPAQSHLAGKQKRQTLNPCLL